MNEGEGPSRTGTYRPPRLGVESSGVEWEAAKGFCLFDSLVEDNRAVRVNAECYWLLDVKQAGKYYLWARVLALDSQHDSFFIDWQPQGPQDSETKRIGGDWHLGQGPDWRWIPLKLNNEVTPLELTSGQWRLTLRPRERDGCVNHFILTTDPHFTPPH